MVHNKTLVMTALMLGLSAGAASAHGIPAPIAGEPYTLNEGAISWTNGVGNSVGTALGDRALAGYHFDVTTAGSLDVYTNDHDDPGSNGSLYVYKLDADGSDWTAVAFSDIFGAPVSGPTNPYNIFGVHRTGWSSEINVGTSDAGVRNNFDVGSYLALVVPNQGYVVGHTPVEGQPDTAIGTKLSAGFTWLWTGDEADLITGYLGQNELTIQASPGSLAVAGATVEPPASVPVPGAVWLMGTVLAGFTAFGRKKAAIAA